MSVAQPLPRWDVSTIYPGLDSPEFAQGMSAFTEAVEQTERLFDEHGVGQRAAAPMDERTVTTAEMAIERMNDLLDQLRTLNAYISAFVTTDSRDALAQARQSELRRTMVRVSQVGTRFTAWVGTLDVEALLARSALAEAHAYPLRQAHEAARHLMSPAEEALAAELNPTGGSAWARLHGNFTSQLQVRVEFADGTQTLPMSMVRNLAYDADRDVRRRAYEAEVAAWADHALPLAAAMNSIKGEVNTLAARRGWASPLDAALFDAHIDRQTLDAMLEAARAAFPHFRRYLRAKARALGIPALTWYDLFAPVGSSARAWDFEEGRGFILEQFASYSPRLSAYADRAFRERWIDAEPRDGKRDGAFCMPLRGEESRILANFKPAFPGVSTLAHELGHGYHNYVLAQRTQLQSHTPMTLAETASIFCETIIRQAALRAANPQEQLVILEASLQGDCQVVVDITSRFLFELGVFEMRRERELSIAELNERMLDAQRQTYGDGLDGDVLHPYMWAVKLHYYSTGRSFYNFPYMFGLLFGLGLYARYTEDPERFTSGYDELLAATGLADAATLARRFGIDIRTPAFWAQSLEIVRADVDRFEALAARAV